MQPAAPRRPPVLSSLGQLAWAMWQQGVGRQIREGRRDVRSIMTWDAEAKHSKPKPTPVVQFVLSLVDVQVLLRAWQVPTQHWPRLIGLWERLVSASYREWMPEDVLQLEAELG